MEKPIIFSTKHIISIKLAERLAKYQRSDDNTKKIGNKKINCKSEIVKKVSNLIIYFEAKIYNNNI